MSDKIRKLTNTVSLSGTLAELSPVKEGVTKETQIPYVMYDGVIQFGESTVCSRKFKGFVKKLSADGSDNKNYKKTLDFLKTAVPLTDAENKEDATQFKILGGLNPNDYVNVSEELIETYTINCNYLDEFKEYNGSVDIEGYIHNISPEVKGEDNQETGRLKVTLISTDFFGNALVLKNIVVPKELKTDFEKAYTLGQTAKLFLDYVPNISEAPKVVGGGIGKKRETEGKSYLELVLTGAEDAIDEDDKTGLSKSAIKILMTERNTVVAEIKAKGYLGNKTTDKKTNSTTTKSRTGISKAVVVEDDDVPF